MQACTGRIGLAKFLYSQKVPRVVSAQCRCRAGEETSRHMALLCIEEAGRRQALRTSGRVNYQQLTRTTKGARQFTEWIIRLGRLGQAAKDNDDELHAYCAYRIVNFHITRPNAASTLPHSPFLDLMIPYHAKDPRIPNTRDEKWWLKAPTIEFLVGSKYFAGACAYRSCRLTSGFEIQT